MLKQQQ